jgi:hypothetical protein
MPILEGSSYASFLIRLSQAADEIVSVQWATEKVTAVPGVDYADASGTVEFLPGETEKTVQVLVYGRAPGDTSERTFRIRVFPAPDVILGASMLNAVIRVINQAGAIVTAVTVANGPDGLSAFEQAKLQGYVGTLAEWLASLKGEEGRAATTQMFEAGLIDADDAEALFARLAATGGPAGGWYNSLEAGAADVDEGEGYYVATPEGDFFAAQKVDGVGRKIVVFATHASFRNNGINLFDEAVGDGVTLDHDALNDVIETAKNWGVGLINCGGAGKTYLIGGTPAKVDANDGQNRYLARLFSNLTFRGNGPGSRPTFKMKGGYEHPGVLFGDRWWDGETVENIAFENIAFDGNMAAQIIPNYPVGTPDNNIDQHQRAIGLLRAKNLHVRNCLFRHWRGDGVAMSTYTYVDDDDPITYSSQLTVEDCEFFDIFSIGISFDGFQMRSRGNYFHGDGYWVGAISCESLSTRGRIQEIWSIADYFDFRDGLSPTAATVRDYATNSAQALAARRHFRPAIALSGNYYTQNPGNVFGGQFGRVSIIHPKVRQGSILAGGFERVFIDAPDIENTYEDISKIWPSRPHAITITPAAGANAVTGLSRAIVRNAVINHDLSYHGIYASAIDDIEISGGSITGPRTAAIRLEDCAGSVSNIKIADYGLKTNRAYWLPLFANEGGMTQDQKNAAADALVGSTGAAVTLFGSKGDITISDVRALDTRTGDAVKSEYAVYANVDTSDIVRIRDVNARGMLAIKDVNNAALVSGVMENTFRVWKTNAKVEIGGGLTSYGNPEFINAADDLSVKLRAPQAKNRTLSFVDENDHLEAQIVHTADGTLQMVMFNDGTPVNAPLALRIDGTMKANWTWETPLQLIADAGDMSFWLWADDDKRLRIKSARPAGSTDGELVGDQTDTPTP